MSAEREPVDDDPVWAAFLRAPVEDETPEERAAVELGKAMGRFVSGTEVTAELEHRGSQCAGAGAGK